MSSQSGTTQRALGRGRRLTGLLIALAVALMLSFGIFAAPPVHAAGSLSVTSSEGSGKASASGATTVTVKGSGFQSVKNGFGGIYVVFGYISSSSGWKPSKGGTSGKDFFYIADSQTKSNKGYQRFVAFPGSSTADSANGGTIAANGTFSTTMVIPGPTFSAATASGGTKNIDCREVTCGIITFGAHGVVNGANEAFTPVSFGAASSGAQTQKETTKDSSTTQNSTTTAPAQQAPTQANGATGTENQQGTQQSGDAAQNGEQTTEQGTTEQGTTEQSTGATGPREAVTSGDPTLGLEQGTVIAGRSLGFTGRGFAAGEQVVATLSSGLSAAGPVVAGEFGEIAGTVQIPADTVAGTHKIKLTGAGSGTSVEAEFSVMADAQALASATPENQQPIRWSLIAVVVAGALLVVLIISSLISGIMQSRRKAAAASGAAASGKRKVKRPVQKRRRPANRKPRVEKTMEASAAVPQDPDTDDHLETTALDRLEQSFDKERA